MEWHETPSSPLGLALTKQIEWLVTEIPNVTRLYIYIPYFFMIIIFLTPITASALLKDNLKYILMLQHLKLELLELKLLGFFVDRMDILRHLYIILVRCFIMSACTPHAEEFEKQI